MTSLWEVESVVSADGANLGDREGIFSGTRIFKAVPLWQPSPLSSSTTAHVVSGSLSQPLSDQKGAGSGHLHPVDFGINEYAKVPGIKRQQYITLGGKSRDQDRLVL